MITTHPHLYNFSRRRSSNGDAGAVHDLDRAESSSAEPDGEPGHAAITHDEVRAETDGRDWNLARERR